MAPQPHIISACPRTLRCVAAALWLLGAGTACAPTQVLTGNVRPPTLAANVVVYSTAPPNFEQIALICASTRTVFRVGGQQTTDKLVKKLAAHAARLGANGIILDDFSDQRSIELGTGVGSETYTHNADISLGVGGLMSVYKKTGNARAIYVPQ